MKTSNRKSSYRNDDSFTPAQKVVLGIMILLIVAVFGFLGMMMLANRPAQPAPPTENNGPIAFITLTSSPAPSPLPYMTATPIPGWHRFTGGGAEIWLPGGYQGGDFLLDPEAIFQKLEAAGADAANFEQAKQSMEELGTVIFAFDNSLVEVFFTEVYVTQRDLGGAPLNPVVDEFVAQMQIDLPYRVVAREDVDLSIYPVERVMMDRKDTLTDAHYSTYGTRVLYFIKVDSVLWIVQYITDRNQVDARLADFDQSILTFAITP